MAALHGSSKRKNGSLFVIAATSLFAYISAHSKECFAGFGTARYRPMPTEQFLVGNENLWTSFPLSKTTVESRSSSRPSSRRCRGHCCPTGKPILSITESERQRYLLSCGNVYVIRGICAQVNGSRQAAKAWAVGDVRCTCGHAVLCASQLGAKYNDENQMHLLSGRKAYATSASCAQTIEITQANKRYQLSCGKVYVMRGNCAQLNGTRRAAKAWAIGDVRCTCGHAVLCARQLGATYSGENQVPSL